MIAPHQKVEPPFSHIPHTGAPVDLPAQFHDVGTPLLSPQALWPLSWLEKPKAITVPSMEENNIVYHLGSGLKITQMSPEHPHFCPCCSLLPQDPSPALGHKSRTHFQKPDLQLSKAAEACTCLLCTLLLGCGHPGARSSPLPHPITWKAVCLPRLFRGVQGKRVLVEKLPLHKIGLHPCGDLGPRMPLLAENFFRFYTCLFSLIKNIH